MTIPSERKISKVRCRVCEESYESGKSGCPLCGTPNILWESPEYVKFTVEIEKALYRPLQVQAAGQGRRLDQVFVAALEEYIMNHRKGKK